MKKGKILAIVLAVITVFTGILTAVGILLLPAKIAPPEKAAHENLYGVGYGEEIPSASLLLCFPDGSGAFMHFDFSALLTSCYIFEENAEEKATELPYVINCKLDAQKDFLPKLADRLGGIEMEDETGEKKVYFSAAVSDFCEKKLNEEKRKKLALSFFNKIAKTGLSSQDFMFIIEETKATLRYSVCYDWIPHIKTMFSNIVFE